MPVRVAGLEGAIALTAGRTHTCALLEDGTARCWGDTDDGIADTGGTPNGSSLPVPVQGIDGAVGLVAGPDSTCALLGDAGVSCWGSLYWGTGPNDVAFGPSPAIVPRTEGTRDVAIGELHACFLLVDASVACLGRNSEGQLGDGSSDHSRVPVAVRGLVDVTALAAGWSHTCALLEDGTVRCWGGNAEGQLGDGSTDDSCPPWSCLPEPDDPSRQARCDRCGSPVAVGGLEGVIDLETGYERTCALRADDTIACWGYKAAQYPANCPQDGCRAPVEIDLGLGVEPMASAGLPQSMAPARFTMETVGEGSSGPEEWTQADGYREATLSSTVTVEASDPRVSGRLTILVAGREFVPDEDPDEDFSVVVGTARIENEDGAWVGTVDGFWTDDYSDGRLLLAGEGAYEGLTALIRIDEYDGVIFGHGLPAAPNPGSSPPAGPTPAAGPTSPADADRSPVSVPEWPAPQPGLRVGRSLGDPQAPVKVDVYEDPQCPPCARFAEVIEPLLVAGPVTDGEVFLTYKDLTILGQESLDAAVAMRVAETLDHKFWDYQRLLFHNQSGENAGAFRLERLADIAEAVGLDREAFLREMEDPAYLEAVLAEGAEARALGIRSTPSLVINGVITEGSPTWEDLVSLIGAARTSSAAVGPTPTPTSAVTPEPTTR